MWLHGEVFRKYWNAHNTLGHIQGQNFDKLKIQLPRIISMHVPLNKPETDVLKVATPAMVLFY